MIEAFINAWEARKHEVQAKFEAKHPDDYKEVVRNVIEILGNGDRYSDYSPDPSRIHQIDDGDYQGTLVFVIAAYGHQPADYWYCRISYGSCSGCDTLEQIRCYDDGKPIEYQVKQYMTLALHVVQRLKKMDGDIA